MSIVPGNPSPATRPFEEAIFKSLKFEPGQVNKAEVKIGKRSQTVTFQFSLTPEQVEQLDAMAAQPSLT